jgi:hypothetical protein
MEDHRNIRTIIGRIVDQWARGEAVTQDLIDQLPRAARIEMNVQAAAADGSPDVTVRIENGKVSFRRLIR